MFTGTAVTLPIQSSTTSEGGDGSTARGLFVGVLHRLEGQAFACDACSHHGGVTQGSPCSFLCHLFTLPSLGDLARTHTLVFILTQSLGGCHTCAETCASCDSKEHHGIKQKASGESATLRIITSCHERPWDCRAPFPSSLHQ